MLEQIEDARQEGYNNGYETGHDEGYNMGYDDGYDFCEEVNFEKWFQEGKAEAEAEMSGRIDEAREQGKTEGIAQGLEQGRAEGIEEGKQTVYSEVAGINAQFENIISGTDTGGKSFYDEFWDNAQAGLNESQQGIYSGRCWNNKTFRPTSDIILDGNAAYAFINNGFDGDLVEWCENLGIKLIIAPTNALSLFYSARATHLPALDLSKVVSAANVASTCVNAHTIDKIVMPNNAPTPISGMLTWCGALENLVIEGIIYKSLDLSYSKRLTRASITSIMNALSTTTSGLTVTFSQTAVETAFGSTDNAEWTALKNTRSNWTISLV